MKSSKHLLIFAAVLSFLVAIFQFIIAFSPTWSEYFGAPKEITSNLPLLYISGFIATLLFLAFGFYALSGAGSIRRLPLLRFGLIGIGSLYSIRGLSLFPILLEMLGYQIFSEPAPPTALESAIVSLFIGIIYLTGTATRWKHLRKEI